ncbi:MAG TPA: pirin family protein [Burkholderiales bacterium]|jgi:redox-sensitive bicupin YhaK (pirin superfamily)|nr:pirin family protein [Burkholderiales bacterium]
MKNVLRIYRKPEGHWVGDGFPVHTVLDYQRQPELSPFLLLDHFGPAEFGPAEKPRGVGWHPHRGFETVTVLLEGEVEHEDTAGNGGRIGPGDVQWMTAGAGLLHKEFHSEAMTRSGGRFHGLQLWVNLPAKFKLTPPRYQTLTARDIPLVDGVRVIAGEFRGVKGPAQTFTPINLLLVTLKAGKGVELDLRDGYSAALYVPEGKIAVNAEAVDAGELAVFDRKGDRARITAETDAIAFVMNGAPIDEPVAGYGPFVMNTPREIQQAFADFHAGRLGTIPTQEKTS